MVWFDFAFVVCFCVLVLLLFLTHCDLGVVWLGDFMYSGLVIPAYVVLLVCCCH